MLVLGIETSCDETSVAVVEDGTKVRSNVIASSKAAFKALAGVIPEEAARRQVECMIPVLDQALKEADVTLAQVDAIAVTRGPGLLGSLLVGTATARVLAAITKKPLIGVHHTLGHLTSTWLDTADDLPLFPLLTLSVSGGHTDLWYRTSHLQGRLIGRTRDDAAGEAFDKGAAQLGLPYPGGPSIAKAAEKGNAAAYHFPSPLHNEPGCDFSFSGLKTSLKYLLRDLGVSSPP
jgi:N6-L-threonylcarbamoyladenine synthase